MRTRAAVAGMLLVLVGACSSRGSPGTRPPRAVADRDLVLARSGAEIPAAVHRARRLIREHQRGAALVALEPDRPVTPDEPERTWLLIALLSESHMWAEARSRAATLERSAFSAAVQAIVDESPRGALTRLSGWMRSGSPWAHLAAGMAYGALGDVELARSQATQALAAGPSRFVRFEAYALRARTFVEDGLLERASADAAAAIRANPRDARGYALAAEVQRRGGDLLGAVDTLLEALEAAPGSEGYPRRIAELLRKLDDPGEADWAALDAAVGRARGLRTGPALPEMRALEGLVLERLGRETEAIVAYQDALRRDAIPVPLERDLRRLLAVAGRYTEVVQLLRDAVPPDVAADEANLRRPHWQRLSGAVRSAPDAGAAPHERVALARALVDVGALDEALAVLASVRTPDSDDLRAHVAGHVAFEAAFRTLIESGYRVAHRKAAAPALSRVLAEVGRLGTTHLHPDDRAAFAVPSRGVRRVAFIGAWLDHHTDTASPVVAHFRKYGKFLMIGQRETQPTEAIVMSLGSLTNQQAVRTARGTYRHDVAIGYDRTLRGFIDAQGGALGGACLADGIWLDADSTRQSEAELRRALERDATLPARIADRGPLPPDHLDGVFALTDTGGAAARLLMRYVARTRGTRWGTFGTLRAHEFGHVADIHRHLPIARGLPATIALLARNGFSPEAVETELERRAQLGSVVFAPDPDLALVEMLEVLPVFERTPEVHAGGYRDGLERIVRHVYARPELYPQIDRTKRIVSQLDRLSNEQIRQAAAHALR